MSSENKFVQSINAFALDLYRQVSREHPGNLLLSPYSIANVLTMAAVGARGPTAAEMADVLRLHSAIGQSNESLDTQALLRALQSIDTQLGSQEGERERSIRQEISELQQQLDDCKAKIPNVIRVDDDFDEYEKLALQAERLVEEINQRITQVDQYELNIASSLWCQAGFPFCQSYVDLVREYCDGRLFSADFAKQYEQERLRINHWVEEQTKQRINDLIPDGMLDPLIRFVLVNAVYFKGEWKEPFDENQTEPDVFTLSRGTKVEVPFMTDYIHSANYAAFRNDGSPFPTPTMIDRHGADPPCYPDEDGFLMLELMYKGDEISMVLIKPRRHDNLPTVEAMLPSKFDSWMDRLQQFSVRTTLPRFRMEFDTLLSKPLQRLGMKRVFTQPTEEKGADLRGISAVEDPLDQLYISEAIHKSFLEVTEKGTEAAAATALLARAGAAMPTTIPFVPEFHANSPFLLFIRHRPSRLVLFAGRLHDPR